MGTSYATRPLALRPAAVRRTYRGGANIQRWWGVPEPTVTNCPEDWVCSMTPALNAGLPPIPGEGLSCLSDDAAVSLRDLVHADPAGLLGAAHHQIFGDSLALLVKLIDSVDRLSIQVHPDRDFAATYLGSRFGKTEAWYILDAAPVGGQTPYLLAGFKEGVTREEWSRLYWEQAIPDMVNCLNRVVPSPGDVFLIEGGTPHAIGPGCFLIEVQEPTDFTFRAEWSTPDGARIDDRLIHYGLGFEKVLDCFHTGEDAPGRAAANRAIEPRIANSGAGGTETVLLDAQDTDRFAMREVRVRTAMDCTNGGRFSSLVTLSGTGAIEWDGGSVKCRAGDRFFLPFALKEFSLVNDVVGTDLRMIRCYPPLA